MGWDGSWRGASFWSVPLTSCFVEWRCLVHHLWLTVPDEWSPSQRTTSDVQFVRRKYYNTSAIINVSRLSCPGGKAATIDKYKCLPVIIFGDSPTHCFESWHNFLGLSPACPKHTFNTSFIVGDCDIYWRTKNPNRRVSSPSRTADKNWLPQASPYLVCSDVPLSTPSPYKSSAPPHFRSEPRWRCRAGPSIRLRRKLMENRSSTGAIWPPAATQATQQTRRGRELIVGLAGCWLYIDTRRRRLFSSRPREVSIRFVEKWKGLGDDGIRVADGEFRRIWAYRICWQNFDMFVWISWWRVGSVSFNTWSESRELLNSSDQCQ